MAPKNARRPAKDADDHPSGGVGIDEEAREVYLSGTVDQDKAGALIAAVRRLDRTKGLICVVISSSGGGEGAGWAMFDAIDMCRNQTVGLAYGECQSIAALVLQACKIRLLAPNCRVMIHNGSVELSTGITTINAVTKEIQAVTDSYYEVLAERSGMSFQRIKNLCDAETFMGAQEAVDKGFADGIISRTSQRKRR